MNNRIFTILIIANISLLAACTNSIKRPYAESHPLSKDAALLTTAEYRAIIRTERNGKTITCTEPSPDVAKAISDSISTSVSALIKGLPNGVSPQVAASFTNSAAASIAQLGERLATIQLLRDGLYRACEGYAQGALSETAYAVLLSRYDDTMVTLLSTEMAAGAFGRTLASISGEANSEGEASLEHQEKISIMQETVSEFKETLKRSKEINKELEHLREQKGLLQSVANTEGISEEQQSEFMEQLKNVENEIQSAELEQESNNKNLEKSDKELHNKLNSTAKSVAKSTATSAGGITPGKQTKEIATVIEEIQKNYVENINSDAVDVACLVALDRKDADLTKLSEVCIDKNLFEKSGILKKHIFSTLMEYRALKYGVSLSAGRAYDKNNIWKVQNALNALNNAKLKVDGKYGKDTKKAVMDFQKEHGLSNTGKLDVKTTQKINELISPEDE
jgi:murein L,D-transpeptidase YcbB/YkuD